MRQRNRAHRNRNQGSGCNLPFPDVPQWKNQDDGEKHQRKFNCKRKNLSCARHAKCADLRVATDRPRPAPCADEFICRRNGESGLSEPFLRRTRNPSRCKNDVDLLQVALVCDSRNRRRRALPRHRDKARAFDRRDAAHIGTQKREPSLGRVPRGGAPVRQIGQRVRRAEVRQRG